MIMAQHNHAANFIFNIYMDRLLRKHFGNFCLLSEIPDFSAPGGIILAPNHFSWWDGFLIHYITRKLSKRKFHILMLEDQLKRYWFFKYLGAFSIDLSNPRSMARTLEYTRSLLNSNNNVVVIYPQGEMVPYDLRPLPVKNGIEYVIKDNNSVIIIPIAFKLFFADNKKPDILCRFGQSIRVPSYSHARFIDLFNKNVSALDGLTSKDALYKLF